MVRRILPWRDFSRGQIAAVCLLLLPSFPTRAQQAEEADAWKYAPEVEKKFAELMKKVGELKSTAETTQFKRETAGLAKVAGLDEAGQKTLDAAAVVAVEAAVKEWRTKTEATLRTSWGPSVEEALMDTWLAQSSSLVRNDGGSDYVGALEQPAWQEALARTLSPQQAGAWKADVEERRRKFDEETKNVVAATRSRYREMDAQAITATVSAVAQTLSLDEERRKKLEKLGEQAAEKSSDGIREKARKTLLRFDESARKQAIKSNSLYIAVVETDGPETQAVWKDGLKEILTPEEMKRWETAIEQRAERRVSRFARMLVWALDQAVAFTATQRAQMWPLAEKWVREKKSLFVERRGNSYMSYSTDTFYRAAASAKEEDLQKILDGKQLARWKTVCGRPTAAQRLTALRARNVSAAKERTKLASFEPEELEGAISDQLAEMAEREKEMALANYLLQAEDAIRVAAIEGRAVQRLQTAARGAMEVEFDGWRENWATQIRSQLQGATPADFQQRIENIGLNSMNRRRPAAVAEKDGIWEKTVAAELTDAQRAAWKKETDARDADEQETVVAVLLGELDRLCLLTEEQRGKFEPMLAAHLKEYGPDLVFMGLRLPA